MTPLSLSFNASQGSPQPQLLSVSSSTGPLPFTATIASGTFLSVFPSSGTATVGALNNVQVAVTTPNLANGTYMGTIVIATGSQSFTVNVTYTVGQSGGGGGGGTGPIAASPTSLTFNVAVGQASSQVLNLSTTGTAIDITIQPHITTPSNGTWLSINPATANISSSSSLTAMVSVSAGNLTAGTYNGFFNVFQNGSSTAALMVPVTLNVGTTTGAAKITVSPSSLTFQIVSSGSGTQSHTLQVTNTSNQVLTVNASATMNQGTGWLTVSPATVSLGSQSAPFIVSVNPVSLGVGTFNGNVALEVVNEGTVNIGVTVTVGSNTVSELTASPNPLTFSIAANSTTQSFSQTLTVTTSTFLTVNFTSTASTVSGGSWLSVNPASLQPVTLNTSVKLNVGVDSAGLNTGQTYTGAITLTPNDGTTPLMVPVTVTIGGSAVLTVAPSMLTFAYQTGTAFPPAQSLSLTSSGTAIAFSATPSTTSGGNWLVVSPQSGATAATGGGAENVTVQVNPSGLAAGTYNGTVNIGATSASNSMQSIPISLLVSNQPILNLSNSSVTFNYQFGSTTLPVQQQVQIVSSGNPLTFSASIAPGSGGNFLMVTPSSGPTPQSLNLSIIPSALSTLAPGTYSETVTVTALGAGNSPVNLTVYLVIGNNTLLNPSQTELLFNYEVGKAVPSVQTFSVTSTGSPLDFTVAAASSNCGSFLSVSPATGTTPGTVAVAINTNGAPVGTCKGTITLTSPDANVGNSPLTIPVTLNVSNSPLLNVSPAAVNITTQIGTSPANQIIALTSTDPATALVFNVTSTTNTGTGWLLVGPTSGSTPNNLTLGFQTAGLGIGTYTGTVTVMPTATGSIPTTIPVTVVITTGTTASASPAMLTFTQPYGGTPPAAQAVQLVSSTAGLSFSATASTFSGGTWLTVTPANGTTPGTIMVSAASSTLGQGSYSGVVTVVIPGAANTPLNIPVTLTVGQALNLTVNPTSAGFTYQAGSGSTPAAQTIQVASTAGSISFAAAATSSTTGLITVSPASGTTPSPLSISLNQTVLSTLAAGTYTGTVTLTSSSLPGSSLTVNVTVTVQPAATPALTSVVNAASNLAGPVSPGEIISLYGTNIGPATPQGLQLSSTGTVLTQLGTTEVTFDGIASPLTYVSGAQINAIVPYSIAGRVTTNVVVMNAGVASASLMLNVADTAPAIFSVSQGGSGQGAILNQNNTPNSASNPAAAGSVISIYATGEGMLNPSSTTGGVTSLTPPFPVPTATPIAVTIGGVAAQIEYAGEAPGLVSGVLQVNAVVPAGLGTTGPKAVVLTVGTATNAQQTITVAVQ